MTEFLTVEGGTIAYEVTGQGPLAVLAHGMGDSRASYRFVVPKLVAAGYRAAAVDLRGCGESSTDWPTYSRTDIGGDLVALVRHLEVRRCWWDTRSPAARSPSPRRRLPS